MRPVLLLALCATLALSLGSLWLPPAEPEAVAQAEAQALLPQRTQPPRSAALAPIGTLAGAGRAVAPWPLPTAQVLAAWALEPAPAPAVAPARAQPAASGARPAAPAADSANVAAVPAFPYRWIGRFEDSDGVQVFLAGAQGILSVRSGQTIDGRWKLEQVQERQLQFTWLATGEPVQVQAL
jgi:hypothetical protein